MARDSEADFAPEAVISVEIADGCGDVNVEAGGNMMKRRALNKSLKRGRSIRVARTAVGDAKDEFPDTEF